ncbi:transcription antiterminator [Virgibacillus sp. NKC19-3]|uniref:BglG family transcription antiterminator n=1 Tax=Virgibacillus saliphilus TaxID=2831674 RepID=UPI001C9A8268|nr:BglG family transcription antiterminator [Virgibacillus sp. NKC19-3]MBY7144361.1 transcription antiterminator [Virgibacillus sp. NKC19-3]
MDSRWREIIKLLKHADVPVTSLNLATDLKVSSKTVRNDIKGLNSLLRNYNITIDAYKGKGYVLNIKDEEDFRYFLQQYVKEEIRTVPNEPDKRVDFLMEKILLQTDYIKMEDLAEELYISRSTLQADLKIVRAILEEYDLSIEHKPNYGIKVIGKETLIRFCISEYIFNQKPVFMEEYTHWLKMLPEADLEIIRNSILKNLRKHHIIISDISLQNLITHLAIAWKRIQEDQSIQIVHEELLEVKNEKEYLVAKEMMQEIEAGLGVRFPENEVAYLSIHLQGTTLTNSVKEKENMNAVVHNDIQNLARDMVKRIDAKYALGLSSDEELLRHLSLHLKPAINRYRHQMNIRNPMLEDIKRKYPLSFEAALIGVDILDEQLDIVVNEDEIGYLALHIEVAQERRKKATSHVKRCLIVCASGLGSAQLLQFKLQDKFKEDLEIIGTTEHYNLTHQSLNGVDFIISTIPIELDLSVPVIYVNTILGDSDVMVIERMLAKDKSVFASYMRQKYTFLNKEFETPEAVIRFLGDVLMQDGVVESDYIDSVLEREHYAPTSFGNLLAIPHPLEPKTDTTFWTIVTLKKPILWGDKLVQVIFLLNVNKTKKEDLKPMFQSLGKLTDNKRAVMRFLECETYAQLEEIIKTM